MTEVVEGALQIFWGRGFLSYFWQQGRGFFMEWQAIELGDQHLVRALCPDQRIQATEVEVGFAVVGHALGLGFKLSYKLSDGDMHGPCRVLGLFRREDKRAWRMTKSEYDGKQLAHIIIIDEDCNSGKAWSSCL